MTNKERMYELFPIFINVYVYKKITVTQILMQFAITSDKPIGSDCCILNKISTEVRI